MFVSETPCAMCFHLMVLTLTVFFLTGCPPIPKENQDETPGGIDTEEMVDMGDFEIDATEVTRKRYREFLAEELPLAVDYECFWNEDRQPSCEWLEDEDDLLPATCIDWCDARDYCLWKDKRLCEGDWALPGNDEWQRACSLEGERIYPYGNKFSPKACNGYGLKKKKTLAVGSLASCQGGLRGLYDMSGNVFEWTGVCDAGSGRDVPCRLRGGSFANEKEHLSCGYDFGADDPRGMANEIIGFRCCR